LARKELQKLQKEAKELSSDLLVIRGRIILKREERGNDVIQERSNSDFDVKCAIIQFYGNSHNSQFDRWIGLKVYVESSDMLSCVTLTF
jgi:hypothetical protein